MNGYTKADNWLWDYVMPRARPNTFKVVAAVVRKTAGWHQGSAVITFDDFQRMTGISSRNTLTDAINDAMAEGFIARDSDGRSYSYSPKIVPVDSTETVPVASRQSENRTDEQYRNRTANSTETVLPASTTTKEKKENNYTPPAPPRANGSGSGGHDRDFDEEYRQVVATYEREFGSDVTQHLSKKIVQSLVNFHAAQIVEAITIAVENNVKKWRYVERILERWLAEGKGVTAPPPNSTAQVRMVLPDYLTRSGEKLDARAN